MIYIQKRHASPEVAAEIRRVKEDTKWDNIDHTNHELVRGAFDQLNKEIIRKQLLQEQKGLCAYCMRRIRDDALQSVVIEHWRPITEDGDAALEYENMMACCDGGSRVDADPHILCCDASKGNHSITISPYNKSHMDRIRYDKDGIIRIYPESAELTRDINEVLKLNGEIDEKGNVIHDTATRLLYGRRQVYKHFEDYIKRLAKQGKAIKPTVQQRIEQINQADQYVEYAGVWLYFLKRKLKAI